MPTGPIPSSPTPPTSLPPYAELHCASNFSFLRGASHPEELVDRALSLGYSALAITDECSLAGVVRAHLQARKTKMPVRIGSEFATRHWTPLSGCEDDDHGARLVLLARTREGYGHLSELITRARRRADKGEYRLMRDDLAQGLAQNVALWVPRVGTRVETLCAQLRWLKDRFAGHLWLAAELHATGHDMAWLERLQQAGGHCGVPLVAAGDVHFHLRSRKILQDTLTAIRLNTTVAEAGYALQSNAERHLRTRLRLAQLYPRALMEETLEVAAHCSFSLEELRYEYPDEIVPASHTPASWLRTLTDRGRSRRYPDGTPPKVLAQIEHELELIADLRYEPYFLTVADIVDFARERGILCQGRGSAANSAVCYCLGITEVDPARMSVLFERFISRERNEPPDIDVDFEHQRREEVMQYLYEKYGRDRAALTATVISYRTKSAVRDVGKALGIDLQRIERLMQQHHWWDNGVRGNELQKTGFDPESPIVRRWLDLAKTLMGFPRHLSQHTGGFVIARDSLARLVPIENAAMADRSVIQWDKDDLDALGLLKVDVLALGMLTAIRRSLQFITQRRTPPALALHGPPLPGEAQLGMQPFRMQDIPPEDRDTYDMICAADTIGVFQIESRAQMSMLPRLLPRCFYDLVVEVAIVRPGPIQGGMVHPYLRRRQGLEPIDYQNDAIRPAIERTLGVPIFQEQVMQIAMLAAGFSAGEADQLRRAMAAWRRRGSLEPFREKLTEGMRARGYDLDFAERIFKQMQGFGEYGFPESHAASFALLVYVSAWLKRHEPAAFLAGLLDAQPMGFYAPAQLVRDARAHDIEVRAVDVHHSHVRSTLEERCDPSIAPHVLDGVDYRPQPAVRLGLDRIRGLSTECAERIVAARVSRQGRNGGRNGGRDGPWSSIPEFAREARVGAKELRLLAQANALAGLSRHRADAAWQVAGIETMPELLENAPVEDSRVVDLPAPKPGLDTIADYHSIGIPMGAHPLALLRPRFARLGVRTAEELKDCDNGRFVRASGLVTHRQRPETAKGVLFLTLEDETGAVNIILWPQVFERFRSEVLGGKLLTIHGRWQRDSPGGIVTSLLASRVVDHSAWLGQLDAKSRDFR